MSLALILGFLLHLIGDYLLQNDWMATNKTKDSFVCSIHCFLYTIPFYVIFGSGYYIWIIFGTHFFIDRFRLAVYWIKLVNWNWKSKNFGYSDDKPLFISLWLMFIIDNIFHILINSLAIFLHYDGIL